MQKQLGVNYRALLGEHRAGPLCEIEPMSSTQNEWLDIDWLNTDVSQDQYAVVMDSYYHLGDILAEYGGIPWGVSAAMSY